MTKKCKLNTKFSDIEDGEICHSPVNSCYYIYTNDIKDSRLVPSLLCNITVQNIFTRIHSFDSEVTRKEILQELEKLKTDISNISNFLKN